MTDLPRPPAHVEPFVRVLGVDLAIAFLLEFGGADLAIRPNPQSRGRLSQLVGLERARALADAAADMPRRIPLAKPWIAAVWHQKGLPKAEIARKLHTTEVSVRRWLAAPSNRKRPNPDPRQMKLI